MSKSVWHHLSLDEATLGWGTKEMSLPVKQRVFRSELQGSSGGHFAR